jgi:hypothetical protein
LVGLETIAPIIQQLTKLIVSPKVDSLAAAALVHEQQRTARPHKRQLLQPAHFLNADMSDMLASCDEFHDPVTRNIAAIIEARR